MSTIKHTASQVNDNMRDFIVYLILNYRDQVLKLLGSNGMVMTSSDNNSDILNAVYEGLGKNEKFAKGLRDLMTSVAAYELKKKSAYSGYLGEEESGAAEGNGGGGTGANTGTGNTGGNTGSGVKKGFGNTAVGGFLGNLFSKDNVNKYIDTGIGLLQSQAQQKNNQQQIDMAQLQLQQAQGLNYVGGGATPPTSNKWVLPVVVGVLVVGAIITIVLVTRRKK